MSLEDKVINHWAASMEIESDHWFEDKLPAEQVNAIRNINDVYRATWKKIAPFVSAKQRELMEELVNAD